jgi:hypothetical protein
MTELEGGIARNKKSRSQWLEVPTPIKKSSGVVGKTQSPICRRENKS